MGLMLIWGDDINLAHGAIIVIGMFAYCLVNYSPPVHPYVAVLAMILFGIALYWIGQHRVTGGGPVGLQSVSWRGCAFISMHNMQPSRGIPSFSNRGDSKRVRDERFFGIDSPLKRGRGENLFR